LLRSGFARVDGQGLFAEDRYITPDQIGSVVDGRVLLNLTQDELIET
jgi:hypothetical protein